MSGKNDAIIQTSIDRRVLAKIALHMQEQGFTPRSTSEMIRTIISVYETWVDKQGATPIESTEEATVILKDMFKASLNPGDRYRKSMLQNMESGNEEIVNWETNTVNIKPTKFSKKWTEDDRLRAMEVIRKTATNPQFIAKIEQNRKATSSPSEVIENES